MRRNRDAASSVYPAGPDADAWAARATTDAQMPNAGASQLERALDVIAHQGLADLAAAPFVAHDPASAPLPRRRRRRPPRAEQRGRRQRGDESLLLRLFRLALIVASGVLGVALAERAFYVFQLPPLETRVVVVAVELLLVYAGHRVGGRKAAWSQLDRAARNSTRLLTITLVSTLGAVFYVRATVLIQDLGNRRAELSLPAALWMFLSLGALLAMAAVDAGMASRVAAPEVLTRLQADRAGLAAWSYRKSRHELWLACLAAYHHHYVANAPTELVPELEMVKPPEIPLDPLPTEWDAQGETA